MIYLAPRLNVMDVAGSRSSHEGEVPRAGGLGPLVGALVGVLFVVVSGDVDLTPDITFGLIVLSLIALVGLADDLRNLSALTRLVLQAAFGLGTSLFWFSEGRSLTVLAVLVVATTVWFIFSINAVNFMDGVNGLAGTMAALMMAALIVARVGSDLPAEGLLMAVLIGGGVLGFLPFNLLSGRVFLGDVGSYFLGGAVGIAGVFSVNDPLALMLMFSTFSIFTFDVLFTLARRALAGQNLFQPHRDHLYQMYARSSGSHLSVVRLFATLTAVSAFAAVVLNLLPVGPVLSWSLFSSVQIALLASYHAIAIRPSSHLVGVGQ